MGTTSGKDNNHKAGKCSLIKWKQIRIAQAQLAKDPFGRQRYAMFLLVLRTFCMTRAWREFIKAPACTGSNIGFAALQTHQKWKSWSPIHIKGLKNLSSESQVVVKPLTNLTLHEVLNQTHFSEIFQAKVVPILENPKIGTTKKANSH